MRSSSLLPLLLVASLAVLSLASASVPVESQSGSPIPSLSVGGSTVDSPAAWHPNPPVRNGRRARLSMRRPPPRAEEEQRKYSTGVEFVGAYGGVPVNPTAHLQASLEDDRKYIASIMRAPLDLGDPTDCKHEDLVRDEQELRRIALRINHRRIALRQQQHWLESAREGVARIEREIASTTDNARNLAEQLDALHAQRQDIMNHVRRAVLLKELDATGANLMRLKSARMKAEVSAQDKHNANALKNHEFEQTLGKLHDMRTKQGLALGKFDDPKPYRFAQQGLESAAEETSQNAAFAELESRIGTDADTESELDADAEQETDLNQAEE